VPDHRAVEAKFLGTRLRRTSHNSVKAKFAEFTFQSETSPRSLGSVALLMNRLYREAP
jgi:hypothetical protein